MTARRECAEGPVEFGPCSRYKHIVADTEVLIYLVDKDTFSEAFEDVSAINSTIAPEVGRVVLGFSWVVTAALEKSITDTVQLLMHEARAQKRRT